MNEAPKTIFLNNSDLEGNWDWDYHEGITWSSDRIDDTDIEYIRKDEYDQAQARIERLEEALSKVTCNALAKESGG